MPRRRTGSKGLRSGIKRQENRAVRARPKPLAPQSTPPGSNVLARQIVPAGDITHRRATNANLAQDRQLLLIRPVPPPLNTDNNLMTHIPLLPDTTSLTTSITTEYKIWPRCQAGGSNRVVTFKVSTPNLQIQIHGGYPQTLPSNERAKVADFYAARDTTSAPLPWPSIAPPFTFAHLRSMKATISRKPSIPQSA